MEPQIILFDPADRHHIDAIAYMHKKVLPESNVPGLGTIFMKKFYYNILPKKNLLRCYLCYIENKPAGFIVTNKYPFSLIRKGMEGKKLYTSWILFTSLLSHPSGILSLLKQLRYKPDPLLEKYESSKNTFEVLTIGVLEEYRQLVFEDGKKISNKLLDRAIHYYKNEDYKFITGQILKSNTAVLKFYQKYHAKYIDSSVRDAGVIMEIEM